MVGAGVGAGIMAVPFLAESVGLAGLALILPVAWAASSLIHLMLAEVLFRTGRDMQIVELMQLYLLGGRIGRWLLWVVFAFLSIAFLANLRPISPVRERSWPTWPGSTCAWPSFLFTPFQPAWCFLA
jgi:amino acid permease